MRKQRHIVFGLVLGFVLFAGANTVDAQIRDLFNNTNSFAVSNGGAIRPRFLLNVPTRITQLVTYHWNNGGGATPGQISLRGVNNNGQPNGLFFGPFSAIGTPGYGGRANVNWVANPNVNVPGGFYEVVDSGNNTWSSNPQSAGQGFAIVRGFALATTAPAPVRPGFGRGRVTLPQPAADQGSDNPNTCTRYFSAVGSITSPQAIADGIGGSDTDDWYCLDVAFANGSPFYPPRSVTVQLVAQSPGVGLAVVANGQIKNYYGAVVASPMTVVGGAPAGPTTKTINLTLFEGPYLIHVIGSGVAPTNYVLTVSQP